MALNPQYDEIGKGFVQQYYALFDDPEQRPNLINLYSVSTLMKQLCMNFISICCRFPTVKQFGDNKSEKM